MIVSLKVQKAKTLLFMLVVVMLVSFFYQINSNAEDNTQEVFPYTVYQNTQGISGGYGTALGLANNYTSASFEFDLALTNTNEDWAGLILNMDEQYKNAPAAGVWDSAVMVYFRGDGKIAATGIDQLNNMEGSANLTIPSYESGQKYNVKVTYIENENTVTIYTKKDGEETYQQVGTGKVAADRPKQGYAGFFITGNAGISNIVVKQQTAPENVTNKAQAIADDIDILYKPLRDQEKISLPQIENGFRIEIESTDPEGYIDNVGNITRPASGADVDVTINLKVINESDESDIGRQTLVVPISAQYKAPEQDSEYVKQQKAEYERNKYGLFVHYVPNLTTDATGQTVTDIDELANDLDVGEFAKEVNEMGMEYVIFTVWHADQLTLYPSEVNKRWRDDRREEPGQKTYSDRDVIMDLYNALKEYDIDLHLYTHPVDGHDFTKEDQELTGWNDCGGSASGSHEKWNQFQNELYDELCKRYAGKIKGIWFDGMFQHSNQHWDTIIEQDRFRETLTAYDKGLILIANTATSRNNVNGWGAVDYLCWETASADSKDGFDFVSLNPAAKDDDAKTWPATTTQVAITAREYGWWTGGKELDTQFTKENYFLYTVAQACASSSGGIAWSGGCFPGDLQDNAYNGNLFEGDFYGKLSTMYSDYLKPIEESVKNTNAGKAYPLKQGEWLGKKEWGASTESADGKYVYLHVVNQPQENFLQIGIPEDGSLFSTQAQILNFDGTTTNIELERLEDGYKIVLPDGVTWNSLDTVIKLERITEDSVEYLEYFIEKTEQEFASNPVWLCSEELLNKYYENVNNAKEIASGTSTETEIKNAINNLKAVLAELLEAASGATSTAGENYAFMKDVDPSTTLENGEFSAKYLTDGNKLGNVNRGWTSNPESSTPNKEEYIVVDLGEIKRSGRIDLTPSCKEGYGFPKDFYIEISEDGENYTKIYERENYISNGETFSVFFNSKSMRYVKVTGTELTVDGPNYNNYRMQFSEIEVFPMSVEEAAYNVASVPEPENGITQLGMPEVAEGFTITGITDSSDPAIVALDGSISYPEKDTIVKLCFGVKRNSDGATAETRTLSVKISGTEEPECDKTKLAETIEKAESIELNEYIISGKDEFKEALENAKKVMADDDASQAEIDKVCDKLTETMSALKYKANKEELQKLLSSLLDMDLSDYTKDSVEYFTKTLKKAQSILKDESLSVDDQDVIDQMIKDLKAAKNNLKEDTITNNDPTDKSDEKGESVDNTATSSSVQTGDSSNILGWLLIMGSCICVIGWCGYKKLVK